MKTLPRKSKWTRAFSWFVMLQFLNVQLQTAFATEAMQSVALEQSPEVRVALDLMRARLAALLENRSERVQMKIAYNLYKLDVRARNRTFRNSDEEVQARFEKMDQGLIDEQALGQVEPELQSLVDEATQKTAHAPSSDALSRKEIRREKILQNSDPVLISLGSELGASGKLTRASFKTFQDRVYALKNANDSRAPASVIGVILKILLCLLVLAVGLGIVLVTGVVIALSMLGTGAGISMWYFWGILAAVGIGEFFGIRAIIRADVGRRIGSPCQNLT